MNRWLRHRNYVLVGGSVLVLLFLFLTDPNHGALTITYLGQLATPIIAVWFAFIARRALFDYVNVEMTFKEAMKTPVGAAIVFLGICLVTFGLLGLFGSSAHAQDVKTYVPEKAHIYLPIVRAEQKALWVDHPKPLSWVA